MTRRTRSHHNHKTSSDTESDQLDWDPERIDDDGHPLVDENGSTLVPVPREGPLEEDEASSLTAWAQGVTTPSAAFELALELARRHW